MPATCFAAPPILFAEQVIPGADAWAGRAKALRYDITVRLEPDTTYSFCRGFCYSCAMKKQHFLLLAILVLGTGFVLFTAPVYAQESHAAVSKPEKPGGYVLERDKDMRWYIAE